VLITFTLVGIAGLVGGVLAARSAHRLILKGKLVWWRIQAIPIVAGVVLATLLATRSYSASDSLRIVGFPFPAAAFERHHGVWLDFVGPTTVPFFLANIAFFLVLPQFIVMWRLRRVVTKQAV
jgi:hypothetical protein